MRIENPPEGIKPGLSVQADILTGFRAQALVVPIQALVVREDEQGGTRAAPAAGTAPTEDAAPPAAGPRREVEGVFLVVDGKTVRSAPSKRGCSAELSVEVVKGLEGGETIVTGPFRELRSLKPGESVRRSEPGEAAPPEA